MLRLLFVIALLSFAQGKKHNTKNVTNCIATSPEVIEAGTKFFTCFDTEVNNVLKDDNKTCSTRLPDTILDYVKVTNETCFNGSISRGRDGAKFYDFFQHSLKIAKFKDFIKTGGAKCINSIGKKIRKCVQNEIGNVKGADNKYQTLWRKTKYTIDTKKACKEANRIKACALRTINSEYNCKYEINNELYVRSLFDYMLTKCTERDPDWLHKSKPLKEQQPQLKNDIRTTHVLLGLLFTLVLLNILYTIIRDCRRPNGRWKSTIERFSMRQRQRSLVNEESHVN